MPKRSERALLKIAGYAANFDSGIEAEIEIPGHS
jgi:hypothetical protein